MTKLVLAAVAVLALAGCAGRYYDDGYGYHDRYYGDRYYGDRHDRSGYYGDRDRNDDRWHDDRDRY